MEGKTTNIRAHAEPRQRRPGILTLGGCSVLQTLTCQGGREGGNIFMSKEIKFCIAVLYVCMTHILRSDQDTLSPYCSYCPEHIHSFACYSSIYNCIISLLSPDCWKQSLISWLTFSFYFEKLYTLVTLLLKKIWKLSDKKKVNLYHFRSHS